MRILAAVAGVIERLGRVAVILAGAVMFLIVIMIVYETLARYLFRAPPEWSIEIPGYMQTFITAMALAFTQQVKGHISVGFFEMHLSPKNRGRMSAVLYTVYFVAVNLLAWATFVRMSTSLAEGRLSTVMQIPLFIPELIIFIGFVLLALQVMLDMVRGIDAARKGVEFRMTKGD